MPSKPTVQDDTKQGVGERHSNYSLPVDRGWAWGILLGAFLETVITIGIMKSTGILFVALQDRFDSNSAMTSLISTVQNATYSVCALFITVIVLRMISCRTAVLIGSIVSSAAHIITAYADSIQVVMFSMGVLHGIGLAFLLPTMPLMIGRYFEKRRGFANSFAISGGGIGGLIFAPLLTALLKHFAFSGTFLIIGGFYVQCCVTALLFRPFSFYKEKIIDEDVTRTSLLSASKEDVDTGQDCKESSFSSPNVSDKVTSNPISKHKLIIPVDKSSKEKNIPISKMAKGNRLHELQQKSQSCHHLDFDNSAPSAGSHELLPFTRPRANTTLSVRSAISSVLGTLSTSHVAIYASAEVIPSSFVRPDHIEEEDISDLSSEENFDCVREMNALANVFDFSLFRNPLFILLMMCTSLLCPSSLLLGMYLAPHAKEAGITSSQIAMLLTIIAVIDFCSRISVGLIADRGWCRRSTIIGAACVVLGLVVHLLRFLKGLEGFVAFSVVIGLFAGVYFSLYSVILVDYLTLERLQSSLGFTTLFNGTAIAATFAINGYIRDSTGAYIASFHFMGAELLIGGVVMLFLPWVERRFPQKTLDVS